MEYGSLAQWVGAAASFSAVATALWLSGAEKRANRRSQRPILAIEDFSEPDEEGWLTFRLGVTNPSNKDWAAREIEIVKPASARIIEVQNCNVEEDGKPWSQKFDAHLRDQTAAKSMRLSMRLRPSGTTSNLGQRQSRSDIGWRSFYVKAPEGSSKLVLKLTFDSLEAIPDRFSAKAVRRLS